MTSTTGKCLCGTVQINVDSAKPETAACHCNMCRRWGGGPYLAVECGTDVSFDNEQAITRYDSSDWGQRGFCAKCGTHLFYFLKPAGQYFVPAGLLDIEPQLHLSHQIFFDEKPDYYDFANQTVNMTGEEVFAGFAPPDEG